ncbi:[acyl-carrier-protein] S-malonyltransferase [Paenibacillus sp. PastF-3]|jgi:[acyl-carrier-protein] S-malonyltransferase|uniref:ACP S-malonyltransferase n=1 Tax=unclassified Paenibacillus TaxID=185978 RepID=UPI000BA0FFF7|nr:MULTISPECIES: ACP S-malonyltransferase [unclassified Paenibacillus]MDH6368442.1 [acyl-carrier-protein] S-malonyltransferase [Paenibacillus sp. PastF-3]OZQ81187.1 [acyl-carrier-protein] S-malonyltransferase [Paenibacillus sp. VTT E-133291]
MSKIAFVFPGQGAQAVGMGKDVYDALPNSRAVFEKGDEVLGFPLSKLIFEGPDSDLKQTVNTQPALLTASVAYLEALREQGMKPDYVAGHSLGEYSALVAAGVLSYEDAVTLVRLRGRFMEEAVPGGQGAMAAVLGAEREALAVLCQTISEESGVVELANVNCPGQIVVSGSQEGVNGVVQRVKEAGGKRAIPLEVSGPFHSSMMRAAADRLAEELKKVTFNTPNVPVIVNVTASPVTDPEEIRELLVRQVYSPVLWQDSIEWLIADGVDTFVEIGSGSVLAGLIRKIDKTVKVININTLESVQTVL